MLIILYLFRGLSKFNPTLILISGADLIQVGLASSSEVFKSSSLLSLIAGSLYLSTSLPRFSKSLFLHFSFKSISASCSLRGHSKNTCSNKEERGRGGGIEE